MCRALPRRVPFPGTSRPLPWRENGLLWTRCAASVRARLGVVIGAAISPREALPPRGALSPDARTVNLPRSLSLPCPLAPAAIRWSEAAAQMMKTEIEVKALTKDYPSVLPHAHDCLLPMMSDRQSDERDCAKHRRSARLPLPFPHFALLLCLSLLLPSARRMSESAA